MDYNKLIEILNSDEFNKLSYSKKVIYIREHLTLLGSGSGRTVFDIDGTKVLKLAKNIKGVAQNEVEYQLANSYYKPSIINNIYDGSDDFIWVTSEKAKKVSEKRICILTGIPSLWDLRTYIEYGKPDLTENEFAVDCEDLVNTNGLAVFDLTRASSYGEVVKDGSPEIVIVDYGLNNYVWNKHYAPKQKMYELFDFQHGNTDILTDFDNNDLETKNGMWAQIPYGVSDNDVINEEFINFVMKKEKYPNKRIKSISRIADEFDNCVNNYKGYIKRVEDKEKFHNNLLALQEYLTLNEYVIKEQIGGIVRTINRQISEDGTSKFSFDNAIGQDNIETAEVLMERVISAIKGSGLVTLNKKCRLGGGETCNQGEIKNINIKPIHEEIDASEAYNVNDSLQTVLDGKRNICLIRTNYDKDIIDTINNNQLHTILVQQLKHDVGTCIVFNDKGEDNALKLHQYMKSRGGYVSDKTPQEGYYVGKLLGYTDESIWKYIKFKIDSGVYVINNINDIPKNLQKYFDNSEFNSTFVDNEYNDSYLNHMTEEVDVSTENLPFKNDVESLGGKIYSVGGAVRDEFLNKISKDLDLLITNIPMDKLETILSKYGTVNSVGKSFGVLKFKLDGATEDIDIAIPRTDKKTNGGHKGFEITSDHTLPIENDLYRRDFTINAIAKDINNNIVDPYKGREDLKNKIIRVVNPKAFGEDPLRMLRAVQFSSRFNFQIEPNTMKLIQENASKINEIAPERILIEFEKIVTKGNPRIGVQLLKDTLLYKYIFGFDIKQSKIDSRPFDYVKTVGEFIFLLLNSVENPSELYLQRFSSEDSKRDKIYKEIKALSQAYNTTYRTDNPIALRSIVHNMYSIYPESINSGILPEGYDSVVSEFKNGKYPLTFSQLDVNGDDLIDIGLKGKAIGDTLKNVLLKIYSNKLQNNKSDIINFIQSNNVNEGVADKYAEKEFGIPDEFTKHSIIQKTQENQNKPVAKFKTRRGFVIPIYKNPKSLEGFENNVRAISDLEGNIYVTPYDKDFVHDEIGIALGLQWTEVYYYVGNNVEDFKYLILLRIGDTNKFGLSTSNSDVIYKGSDVEKKRLEYLLKQVKNKNPQFEYTGKLHWKPFTSGVKNEGVADKYAEREFGIPNTVDNFNKVYDDKTKEQPVASISEKRSIIEKNKKMLSSSIFKNPKSLNNFDNNVRGICTIDGDLFVLDKNISVFHRDIAHVLYAKGLIHNYNIYYDAVGDNFSDYNEMMNYINTFNYVTLIRKENENQFVLSDSMYDVYIKEEFDRLDLILKNTKAKNPQFKFENDLNNTIIENNLVENVSKKINKKGCLMAYCDIDNWNNIINMIKPEDVYDKPDYGVEKNPHVTILYGFDLNKVKSNEVFDLFEHNFPLERIKLSTEKITLFENPEFDVVKFDIDSESLVEMNKVVRKLPNENDFPNYHPHMTIAYVKSGSGKKYVKELKKKYTFYSNKLVYSGEESRKTLKLNDK